MERGSFQEQLKQYIRESGYTNYDFAAISGVNRVNLQRYLAGTRVPNQDTFEQIAKSLRLSSQEHKKFRESYQIAFFGKSSFYLRRVMKDMLENAASVCGAEHYPKNVVFRGEAAKTEVINGSSAVERYLWGALAEPLDCEETVAAYFYVPAEHYILGRSLPTFREKERPVLDRLKITQIVPLTKRSDEFQDHYHNLRVLNSLIPFYFQAGSGYETCFYYTSHAVELHEALIYPYYGIVGSRVLLFSRDMERAVSIKDPQVVEEYRKEFQKIYRECRENRLVTFFDNAEKMLEYFMREDQDSESRYFLEYQPCIALWTDRALLEAALQKEIPNRERFLAILEERVKQLKKSCSLTQYFTEEGLREFVRTGVCADYPPEYVRPFHKKERRLILDRIIADLETGNGKVGIVDRRYLKISGALSLSVSDRCGLNLALYDPDNGFRYLLIQEPSICQAYMTFMKQMEDYGEICSRERTLEILRQYRDSLGEL